MVPAKEASGSGDNDALRTAVEKAVEIIMSPDSTDAAQAKAAQLLTEVKRDNIKLFSEVLHAAMFADEAPREKGDGVFERVFGVLDKDPILHFEPRTYIPTPGITPDVEEAERNAVIAYNVWAALHHFDYAGKLSAAEEMEEERAINYLRDAFDNHRDGFKAGWLSVEDVRDRHVLIADLCHVLSDEDGSNESDSDTFAASHEDDEGNPLWGSDVFSWEELEGDPKIISAILEMDPELREYTERLNRKKWGEDEEE